MEIALILVLLLAADGVMGNIPSATAAGAVKGAARQVARDAATTAGAWNDGRRAGLRATRRGRAWLRVESAIAGGVRGTARSIWTGAREGAREGRARRKEKLARNAAAHEHLRQVRDQARADARAERRARAEERSQERAEKKAQRARRRVAATGIQEPDDPDHLLDDAVGSPEPIYVPALDDAGDPIETDPWANWPATPIPAGSEPAAPATSTGEPMYFTGAPAGTQINDDESVPGLLKAAKAIAEQAQRLIELAEQLALGPDVTGPLSDGVDAFQSAAAAIDAAVQPMIEAVTDAGHGVVGQAAAASFAEQ